MKKLIIIILTIFSISFLFSNVSEASSFWEEVKEGVEGFKPSGDDVIDLNDENITGTFVGIGQVLTTIGVIICVIGLCVLGIKYMTASPEEAAKIKTQLIGLVVAAIVIVGAYGIWSFAYNFLSGITNT